MAAMELSEITVQEPGSGGHHAQQVQRTNTPSELRRFSTPAGLVGEGRLLSESSGFTMSSAIPEASRVKDTRLNRSWAAGNVDKVRVRLPLRRATSELDQDSRTFGGIAGGIAKKRPTVADEKKLSGFLSTFGSVAAVVYTVVFVNSKSGGQTGGMLMSVLHEHLHGMDATKAGVPHPGGSSVALRGEVCDLSNRNEPEATMEKLAVMLRENGELQFRLLVCGGDGTVTWILTALENCKALEGSLHLLPVGIVPLGTGNDLARALGWGGGMRSVGHILRYLEWVLKAQPVPLDQWRLVLRPWQKLPREHKLHSCGSHPQVVQDHHTAMELNRCLDRALEATGDRAERPSSPSLDVYVGFWQNYYSVGLDAKIALAVERSRSSTRCGRSVFRAGLGKLCYAWQGLMNSLGVMIISNKFRRLVVREYEGDEFEALAPDLESRRFGFTCPCRRKSAFRQMMLVNINSYAGGMQVVEKNLPQDVNKPSPGDGQMEVLATRNIFSAFMILLGYKPDFICQAGGLGFSLSRGQHMQQDGEAWELEMGADVLVEPHRTVTMLRASPDAGNFTADMPASFWNAPGTSATSTSATTLLREYHD
eukprot:TRINITY_DN50822_c0_g1_i1.p1 TRINITY_DN50822_c0_g1~~TRINITY_DN50822_c0_g1_i1.p1  ORF type:complete len:594 (+),score=85.05 TRINITY_DN50822_c0_g1_i1:96-1877(+)